MQQSIGQHTAELHPNLQLKLVVCLSLDAPALAGQHWPFMLLREEQSSHLAQIMLVSCRVLQMLGHDRISSANTIMSVGGWLARVYLLAFGTKGVDRLVTLGSPHQPPPKVSTLACEASQAV